MQSLYISYITASPYFITKPESLQVGCGERLSVNCSADGFPNPQVQWEVTDQPYINISSPSAGSNTLFMNSTQRAMALTCIAVNHLGTARTKVVVSVNCSSDAGISVKHLLCVCNSEDLEKLVISLI